MSNILYIHILKNQCPEYLADFWSIAASSFLGPIHHFSLAEKCTPAFSSFTISLHQKTPIHGRHPRSKLTIQTCRIGKGAVCLFRYHAILPTRSCKKFDKTCVISREGLPITPSINCIIAFDLVNKDCKSPAISPVIPHLSRSAILIDERGRRSFTTTNESVLAVSIACDVICPWNLEVVDDSWSQAKR
jgi:hypothetical protein